MAERTAQQREYRWLRTALAAVPSGCRIGYPRWGKQFVELPEYVTKAGREGQLELVPLEAAADIDELVREGRCLWFVHTTTCSREHRDSLCEEIERRGAYAPVAETKVPPIEQVTGEFPPRASDIPISLGPLRGAGP